jgi:predicted transcriptional regulator
MIVGSHLKIKKMKKNIISFNKKKLKQEIIINAISPIDIKKGEKIEIKLEGYGNDIDEFFNFDIKHY